MSFVMSVRSLEARLKLRKSHQIHLRKLALALYSHLPRDSLLYSAEFNTENYVTTILREKIGLFVSEKMSQSQIYSDYFILLQLLNIV